MEKNFRNLDFWGASTSFLCAIHCAVMPLLLSSGMIGGHTWLNSFYFEAIIIGFTFLFIWKSIIKPFLTKKKDIMPVIIVLAGLLLVLLHGLTGSYATIFVVIGGSLIACGHLINYFLSRHAH